MTMSIGGAAAQQLGDDLGGVAEQADRAAAAARRGPRPPSRSASSRSSAAYVAGSGGRPGGRSGTGRRRRQIATPPFMVTASGCAPPMPPQPAGQRDGAGQRAAEPLGGDGGERLVGALQDALGADVDPRAGGHLAVHGQAERLQPAELLPVGPVGDEVGVGDEHPGRPLVGAEDADRLAGLDEQGLVALQVLQRCGRSRRSAPSCGRPGPVPP